jgi:cyclophilin family peptidyl-prolyl cis-trans isomerase
MKKLLFLLLIVVTAGVTSCFWGSSKNKSQQEKMVLISTDYGDIKIKLYNETPLHRDNFIKLASEGFYNDLLFHRVINSFMIQGGDPDSKNAAQGTMLGNGGPGYTIPAEFVSKYYHKKGALAAAREGDNVNPSKASSGSQYYIVQGTVISAEDLGRYEEKMNFQLKRVEFEKYINDPKNIEFKTKVDELSKERKFKELGELTNNNKGFNALWDSLPKQKFSEAQIKDYTTIGGTPHLDGAYTIFGEITEGLEVIDKITALEVDKNNRPLTDIKMSIKVIE